MDKQDEEKNPSKIESAAETVHPIPDLTFTIPYNKLPSSTLKKLDCNLNLDLRERREFVKIIISEIKKDEKVLGIRHFRNITKCIMDKYPNSVTDRIGDTVVGAGYESFVQQLVNRNDNDRRMSNILKRSVEDKPSSEEEPSSVKVSAKKYSYGYINFMPNIENPEELEDIRIKMAGVDCAGESQDTVKKYMEDTFPILRKDLNSGFTIIELKERWPKFFFVKEFISHFNKLMEIDLTTTFSSNLKVNGPILLRYGSSPSKFKKESAELISAMNRENATSGNTRAVTMTVVLLVMLHLSEDSTALFKLLPVSL